MTSSEYGALAQRVLAPHAPRAHQRLVDIFAVEELAAEGASRDDGAQRSRELEIAEIVDRQTRHH